MLFSNYVSGSNIKLFRDVEKDTDTLIIPVFRKLQTKVFNPAPLQALQISRDKLEDIPVFSIFCPDVDPASLHSTVIRELAKYILYIETTETLPMRATLVGRKVTADNCIQECAVFIECPSILFSETGHFVHYTVASKESRAEEYANGSVATKALHHLRTNEDKIVQLYNMLIEL